MLYLLLAVGALTACTRAPAPLSTVADAHLPPPSMQEQSPSSVIMAAEGGAIEEIAASLILAERHAARARDLATLAQLWADDARIIDHRGSDDPAAAYIWQGRDAILDRYLLAVFPSPPPPLSEPIELVVHVDGDMATATLGDDRWQFVLREGRWWLKELAY
ncbi:MAG: DUF4440 domain-containing protein [Caldilinea sp.]|nr:DUF4440 domain-containing protein [Caldilinea sp.]MDW8440488.1 DUF4440 domain-containing protein [Caldilineaceae bacterium]